MLRALTLVYFSCDLHRVAPIRTRHKKVTMLNDTRDLRVARCVSTTARSLLWEAWICISARLLPIRPVTTHSCEALAIALLLVGVSKGARYNT